MRGFKQILHLSRSIRLKLCNQAHVPLLLKQELFLEAFFFRRNSPILIIYLKALFCLFISAACLFVVIFPPRDSFLSIYRMTQLHCSFYSGTTWLKGKLSPFCRVLALVSRVNNVVRVCVCEWGKYCRGVTGARHHPLKGVVFVHPSFIYLFRMSGRRVPCVSFKGD